MIVRKEVEFERDEITTINKFKEIIREMAKEIEISESSIIFYLLDCSEDEIEGRHEIEDIEAFY